MSFIEYRITVGFPFASFLTVATLAFAVPLLLLIPLINLAMFVCFSGRIINVSYEL